jgi:hypothetical protein
VPPLPMRSVPLLMFRPPVEVMLPVMRVSVLGVL